MNGIIPIKAHIGIISQKLLFSCLEPLCAPYSGRRMSTVRKRLTPSSREKLFVGKESLTLAAANAITASSFEADFAMPLARQLTAAIILVGFVVLKDFFIEAVVDLRFHLNKSEASIDL